MRWFLIYYVIGLIYDLADLALRWKRVKGAVDSMADEHGRDHLDDTDVSLIMFVIVPFSALLWPATVFLDLFPQFSPEIVRKHFGK